MQCERNETRAIFRSVQGHLWQLRVLRWKRRGRPLLADGNGQTRRSRTRDLSWRIGSTQRSLITYALVPRFWQIKNTLFAINS